MKRYAVLFMVMVLFTLSATVALAQTSPNGNDNGNGNGSEDYCSKHPEKCQNAPEVPMVLAYPAIGLVGYGAFRISSSFRSRKM